METHLHRGLKPKSPQNDTLKDIKGSYCIAQVLSNIAMLQCIVSQNSLGGLSGLVALLISYALTLDPEASPKVRIFIDHLWRKSHQCYGKWRNWMSCTPSWICKHSEVILTENLSSVERAAQWNPRLVRQRSNGGRARQADVCHRAGDVLARIKLKSTANL